MAVAVSALVSLLHEIFGLDLDSFIEGKSFVDFRLGKLFFNPLQSGPETFYKFLLFFGLFFINSLFTTFNTFTNVTTVNTTNTVTTVITIVG